MTPCLGLVLRSKAIASAAIEAALATTLARESAYNPVAGRFPSVARLHCAH